MNSYRKTKEYKNVVLVKVRHTYSQLLILVISFFVFLAPIQVRAEGEKVISTLVKGNCIYVYVQGISEIQSDSTAQIGNTACLPESLSVAKLADMERPMRTIILLDNSQSISASYHEDIREILMGLIDGALEKEEFKIGMISDGVTYFNDYTNDKESLKQILDHLTYNDQDTYLSDALYEEITGLNEENAGIFTRIIVIADGADNKTIGYTNEEVCRLIERNGYPVYAIGTQEKNNAEQLEILFSFSRASNGEGYLLNKDTENSMIIDALLKDQMNICVRIVPDNSLLDGSNKSILLRLNIAGEEVALVTTADMPFGTGTDIEKETEEIADTLDEEKELPVISVMEEEVKEEDEDAGLQLGLWIPIMMGGLFIIIGGVMICLVIRKRKASEKETQPTKQEPVLPAKKIENNLNILNGNSVMTELVNDDDDDVVGLWKKKYILMKCVEKEETYKVPIQNALCIGRLDKDINLNWDKKVSRNHCEIILRGNLLYIKDNGSANKTYYQDRIVDEETPLISGGIIKVGSCHYLIELIEE